MTAPLPRIKNNRLTGVSELPTRGQFRDDDDLKYLRPLRYRTPAQESKLAALLAAQQSAGAVTRCVTSKTQSKKRPLVITPANAPLMHAIVQILKRYNSSTKDELATIIFKNPENVYSALNKMKLNGFVRAFYADPKPGGKKKILYWTLTEKGKAID